MSENRAGRIKFIRQWQMAEHNKKKNIQRGMKLTVIPPGSYCYHIIDIEDGLDRMPIIHSQVCPYWRRDKTRSEMDSGYCELFGKGDWQLGTMLWDQLKMCDVNDNLEGDNLEGDNLEGDNLENGNPDN